MTKKEWLTCADPMPMLEFLRGKASDRKLRLFACACCRHIWYLLTDERSRSGLEAAEWYADNLECLAEHGEVRVGCLRALEDASGDSESAEFGHAKWHAATAVVCCTEISSSWDSAHDASQEARLAESCNLFEIANHGVEVPFPEPEPSDGTAHLELLYDIFGNPFRPVTINPAWLTPTVVQLAQATYNDRAFDRMPELADALVKAGCDIDEILAHCRSEGRHVRGCWAVDLLLGKK